MPALRRHPVPSANQAPALFAETLRVALVVALDDRGYAMENGAPSPIWPSKSPTTHFEFAAEAPATFGHIVFALFARVAWAL